MANQHWAVVNNVNFIHGIDFAEGLDLQGEFCYAMELTGGNSFIAINNTLVTDKADVKITATIRKSCSKLEPFLFLRYDAPSLNPYATQNAYVMKIENNVNLYKLDLSDPLSIAAATPINSGTTQINANTSYRFSFFSYTLMDGSVVFECNLWENNAWKSEIKHVLMPEILTGNIGFGTFYKFATIQDTCRRVFIDDIEIATPVTFI